MYLIVITLSLCIVYLILFFLFPAFFRSQRENISWRSLISVTILIIASFISFTIADYISEPQLSNRVLHAFGGGFMGILVCFLVLKDSKISIDRFQFFILSALIATSLGVVNEILEFYLQRYTSLLFSSTPDDTWLDLVSNAVGILVASVCFVPFANRKIVLE